ncbi:MAG: carboxypeptidase regulatory-like domain-containing protein [Myxococcales bacterium]|nr:carboxypeptidase regulatory-like domain-containing protein [Myxococcales bacterium]
MPSPRWLLFVLAAFACGPKAPHQPLYAAGSDKDDGHGLLAQASSKLMTGAETEDGLPARPVTTPRRYIDEEYSGEPYGGDPYGGAAYGGASYGSYVPPPWGYPSVNRTPPYQQQVGLSGVIEGTVTWRGALPAKVVSACGPIEPLAISRERGVAGVLVYIERVTTGRVSPNTLGEQRPAIVGGLIVKRGCALAPPLQVVNPLPAQLAIHGDATRMTLAITAAGAMSGAKVQELQEGGRVAFQLRPGVTRVESEDATIGAAFAIGIDSPYYAITDETGRFRIDELAAGTYEITIVHAPIPTVAGGKLTYGAPVTVRRTLRVDAARTSRLDVALGAR